MTVSTKEVMQFIKMTPFQKERLKSEDPERYNELKKEMDRKFPLEDNSVSSEVSPK